jgi:hypothetical protein
MALIIEFSCRFVRSITNCFLNLFIKTSVTSLQIIKHLLFFVKYNYIQDTVIGHRKIFIIDHHLESVATSDAILLIIIGSPLSILKSVISIDFMFISLKKNIYNYVFYAVLHFSLHL